MLQSRDEPSNCAHLNPQPTQPGNIKTWLLFSTFMFGAFCSVTTRITGCYPDTSAPGSPHRHGLSPLSSPLCLPSLSLAICYVLSSSGPSREGKGVSFHCVFTANSRSSQIYMNPPKREATEAHADGEGHGRPTCSRLLHFTLVLNSL